MIISYTLSSDDLRLQSSQASIVVLEIVNGEEYVYEASIPPAGGIHAQSIANVPELAVVFSSSTKK